mmetsp:Transcript_6906/g.25750  ORF Transcript_6906/g.25750 Transcript_6906/m.25750 type:complete len:432 (-) Transcript_6906:2663-3958(-)
MENNIKHIQIEYAYAIKNYKQQNYVKSIDSLLKILELKPNHQMALFLLAKIHEKRDELSEAMSFFKKCGLLEAKLREALIHEREGNMLLAAARVQEVIRRGETDKEDGRHQGEQQKSLGSVDDSNSTASDLIASPSATASSSDSADIRPLPLQTVLADAYFHFGRFHEEGKGVLKDSKKAIECYKKSATAASYYNLGVYYEDIDRSESLRYYEKAAELGDSDAIYNLAVLHEGQDEEKAMQYYEKAADNGSADAFYNLAVFYDKTRNEKAKACENYQKAIEMDHADSMYNLALMYDEGELDKDQGVNRDTAQNRARDLYMQAAKLDHAESLYNLGHMYDHGSCGVRKNSQRAYIYYEKASKHDHKDALFNLGVMCREGQGMEQPDLKQALKYFKKAHELGHKRALVNIGTLIYSEEELEKIRKEEQLKKKK